MDDEGSAAKRSCANVQSEHPYSKHPDTVEFVLNMDGPSYLGERSSQLPAYVRLPLLVKLTSSRPPVWLPETTGGL